MSDAWEHFSGKVDDLGWTDTTNVEAFNYAVHQTMQSLRALLRGGLSNPSDVPSGWVVVNPRVMAELKAAREKVQRVSSLADSWRDAPLCGTTGAHLEELRDALADD